MRVFSQSSGKIDYLEQGCSNKCVANTRQWTAIRPMKLRCSIMIVHLYVTMKKKKGLDCDKELHY